MRQIFLGLGSNLGNRFANLEKAIALLKTKLNIVKIADFIETEPWGKTDQPAFLNTVIEVEVDDLSPLELLQFTQKVEQQMGKDIKEKWGPRLIDIDILWWGQEIIKEENLVIPHRHALQRDFVLRPLAQIAPDFVPPDQTKTVAELANTI